MVDLELPIGKRSKKYRFFEMVPAIISYGAIIVLIALSVIDPSLAAIYLMVVIITLLVKAVGIAYHTIRGHSRLVASQAVDWHARLTDLEHPVQSYRRLERTGVTGYGAVEHLNNLRLMADSVTRFPRPSQIYHAVIVAAYNEAYDVIQPTIESIKVTTTDNDRIILFFAYEERGGVDIEDRKSTRLNSSHRT